MENWKKLGRALLFPPLGIMLLLVPVATAFLVYSMVVLGTETPPAYLSYVLAAYTLTIWCVRLPKLIKSIQAFKTENRYARLWLEDVRLRMRVTLYASFAWNVAYAAMQCWLGYVNGSFWFYSMAIYYCLLAVMRALLARHMSIYRPGERMHAELVKYRICGWVFLVMNLALALMVFFMVYWNRTFYHNEIITIAMAAYTFTTFTFAIISIVKYRRYQSPIYSATKAISLAAACVSMLTLTSTMLTTFGESTTDLAFRRLMLGLIGGAVSAFIITMALYMILQSSRKLKSEKEPTQNGEEAHE